MPLSPKHIPFSHSLRDRVRDSFAPQNEPQSTDVLTPEEIICFLAKSKDTDSSPLATIKRRAAKENRRPDLRPEDKATLVWLCEAFDEWEDQYPLEQPLKDHIRRLLPLAVAMALKDESFYTPGGHALHRLLDALQNGAVGWQTRLDRAGQMLEQRIQRSVEKALDWFNNERLDIAAITQELLAANDRDAARAQRMVQRLAETEEARLKTLSARRDAASDINAGLNQYELPAAIGEFLKGPWYDSAQLVLVKHGGRSREWEQMRRSTVHLMESVQAPTHNDDTRKDRQEQILRHLPGELRRWLLSLEHDSDATDSAIGLVEYAHLRMQHGQTLQLVRIAPIPLEDQTPDLMEDSDEAFSNGDWYRFEDDGELRAQLVLQLENGQHLLFANFVGLKALDLSRSVFSQRLHDGFSERLPNRETFSLCLATAAGIDNEDRYRQFINPGYTPSDPRPAARSDTPDPDPAIADTLATAKDEVRAEASGDLSDGDSDEFDPVLRPPEGAEVEPGLELELDDMDAEPASTPAAAAPHVSPAPPFEPPPAPLAAPSPASVAAPAPTARPYTPSAAPFTPRSVPVEPGAVEQVERGQGDSPVEAPYRATAAPHQPAPVAQQPPSRPAEPATTSYQAPAAAFESRPAPREPASPATPAPLPTQASPAPEPAPPPHPVQPPPAAPAPPPQPPPLQATVREIDVPMGAWLGFHDGETPIMAKLAVFDPRRDNYIFVNRKGIAMRELSRSELRTLMDQGLVDILETRSYFRDEVERAREEKQ